MHKRTQALSLRVGESPLVLHVHILLITRLNDRIVCAYPCISHYKALETQPHKSKVTALQLHDTHGGQRWIAADACRTSLRL